MLPPVSGWLTAVERGGVCEPMGTGERWDGALSTLGPQPRLSLSPRESPVLHRLGWSHWPLSGGHSAVGRWTSIRIFPAPHGTWCPLGVANVSWWLFVLGSSLVGSDLGRGEVKCCCSVAKSCLTVCNPTDCTTQAPLFSIIAWRLLKSMSVELVMLSNYLILCRPLLLLTLKLSQHQGPFQWVGSSHQVAKVLELQLQHQSFQWIFRVDFL